MHLKINIKTVICIAFVLLFVSLVYASDTMLMFVGEDLEVLSIASRKEESAWNAPAIAKVLTQQDIEQAGAQTLAQVLDDQAGFHIEETNEGSILYLRGIPNSALILYDTIPIGSAAEKENSLIDFETSLASIKRIEIIRGAGSVLWGPNAFAGVINAVPFTGKDFSGFQTGVSASSADLGKQAYLRYAKDNGAIASFVSFSARHATEDDTSTNVVKFWNDNQSPSPVSERFGNSSPDDSHYLELYGNFAFSDWLVLSAKLSDSQKAFSVTDWENQYTWEEQKSYQTKLLKLEASKDIGIDSGIRFTGYYSDIGLDETIIDKTFNQKEYSIYGEMIYERSLFASDALLTVGTSYKEDQFKDILIWNSFYPSFFVPFNQFFLPEVSFTDYDNQLISFFGQYRHKINNIEFWAGLRKDYHKKFEDNFSFSSGVAWSVSPEFIVKGIYGSGYRTPFAKQINETTGRNLEQIKNINLQLQYKPNDETQFAITLFQNNIDDHVVADRYEGAGISLPNSQTIDGVELEFKISPFKSFSVFGNATFLENSGTDEAFLYNDYSYLDNDGIEQKHFQYLTHKYDTGSDIMFNLSGVWQIRDNIRLIPQIEYFSERSLYYSVSDETREYPDAWLCNLRLLFTNIKSFDIELFVNNIFNQKLETFDAAPNHTSKRISVGMTLKYKW